MTNEAKIQVGYTGDRQNRPRLCRCPKCGKQHAKSLNELLKRKKNLIHSMGIYEALCNECWEEK